MIFGEDCTEGIVNASHVNTAYTCAITNDDISENGGGGSEDEETGTLTVTLNIFLENGGGYTADQFHIFVDDEEIPQDTPMEYPVGTYTVNEQYGNTGIALALFRLAAGYTATYDLDCGSGGSVTVTSGGSATCRINITDIFTGGGGGGGSTSTNPPTQPTPPPSTSPTPNPEPRVLGDVDVSEEDTMDQEAPVPQVLGAVDQLPRTGGSSTLPLATCVILFVLAYTLVRKYEKRA